MNNAFWVLAVIVFIVGALFIFNRSPIAEPKSYKGRVRHVVDGDSLYLNSMEPQIRLWGVDAPEKDEGGYGAARDYLTTIAEGKAIRCDHVDTDKYGRIVGRCYLGDGREINRMMIGSGTAKEYMRFTNGYYSG